MAAAGIDATLSPVPNSENEPRFIAGDFELMVANSFSPPIDPAQGVNTYLLNTYKLATEPSLSDIKGIAVQAGNPNLTQAERAPLYAKIWETVLQQVWYIPICQLTNGVISNPKVVSADNIPLANTGIWDLRYVAKTR
jgi:peptide/nickel transport system substrate-binding protein